MPHVCHSSPHPPSNALHDPAHARQETRQQRLPGWLSGLVVIGTFLVLSYWERRRPLRRRVEPSGQRTGRNLMIAGFTSLALQMTERPLISRLSRLVTQRNLGLLKQLPLPLWFEIPLAVVLMDYTLYWWHVLTHRLSWLWRFHVVHHIDWDLDVSTAIRFHFAEMVCSVGWRAGQVVLIGVSPLPLSIWQTLLLVSVMFHHSNVALPLAFERRLVQWVVTPRMHGIHHSLVHEETNSNWSSGFTIWDWLHGTLKLDVPQRRVIIGVPAYRQPDDITLLRLLLLPFLPQRDAFG